MPTVLITGANRGLGLEFARQYVASGWRVIATTRNPEQAISLRGLGDAVEIHKLDVTDFPAVAELGRDLAQETIDVFINNAGVGGPRDMRPERIDEPAWTAAFRANAMAGLACAGAFHPMVARSGERKMIAISSRLGSIGANREGGMYAYRSSKAALNAVWHSFAIDHPEVIAVLLHPGWVRTDMGGSDAALSPEESVTAMRQVIAGLEEDDTGNFFNYDGSPIPW
jgi:NAD(P)-dependent dehydrogenase (short-subunit alcohol dehydrogenase family)